ncbi:branched-chain amino acid ABC transporter permease [Pseudooceanicola sediminis]|uniref:Branched-chain amino acid ABC transporter permease n=1 Tax=Pseudooceanicola sediminis TaxID=2211117 RepID=A0A399J3G5_9RHOB|nr:branched-chain amino acid ABC transporter permease [Pseudooceanicola sediminis]KAA2312487.1 branched-chain amino acid ABC transporter permease [Puniceibacterium sp. HSS470]RII37496.1 branched-chain amino acid ABC transporter permease [Pseudooceanicola sediminis]|tara:strand:- start:20259 stop:21527 length:1269 start_codon:yes stop_codon:yes gene_type:complete
MTDMTTTYVDLAPSRAEKFRQRVLPMILFALALAVIPLFGPSRSTLTLLNHMGINIVFALSFNMLLGRAGMLSFGHAVYLGLGGYFCVHVMNWIAADTGIWGAVPIFTMPAFGFGAGALAGAVIGWPSCRRAGTPFAMISLGVAELVAAAGFMFDSLFGGEMGISADRMGGPEFLGLSLGPLNEVYWYIAFWTFVGVVGTYAFTRTPLGKLSEATRDNPERVEFVGYNPQRVRYLVFIFAGAFAGMAGGMSAVQDEIFTPENLSLVPSGAILIAAYVGGIRYFTGPIMGAIVMTYMGSNLSDYTAGWLLYLGLMFVGVVMFVPDGIAGVVYGTWDVLRSGRLNEVAAGWAIRLLGLALMAVSTITLVEVAFRWSDGYGEVFEPFGLELAHGSPLTWVVIVLPFVIGALLLRRVARSESEVTS